MFFSSKKKKIRQYLDDKPKEKYTAFDLLLSDYLDGSLAKRLKTTGLGRCGIDVNWDDDVQFIAIESSYHGYSMDLVVYTDEITIFFTSEDDLPGEPAPEPEACKQQDLPLRSKDQIFDLIKEKLAALD
ncbi:MAG: hypothetical protein IKP55_00190 [Clostridia bacterium]|nr:hypothetical protein [Clostridia bacterium]